MGKISFKLVYALLLVVLFAGCSGGNEPDPITPQPKPDPDPIPQPQPETKSVVTDLSDPIKSGVTVEGYDYQTHSMLVKATADKAPKEGDYLVSGISDKAPYGFLLKTTKVVDHGSGTYAVYSVPAKLNEVLTAKGIKYKGWTKLTPVIKDESRATNPQSINKVSLFNFKKKFTISGGTMSPKDSKDSENSKDNKAETELTLEATYGLYFTDVNIFGSDEDEGCGLKLSLYEDNKMNLSGEIKASLIKEKDLIKKFDPYADNTIYNTYTAVIMGVPVVVTLKSSVKIPFELSLTAKGDIDIYKRRCYYHIGAKFEDSLTPEPLSELGGEYIKREIVEDYDVPTSEYSTTSVSATTKMSIKLDFDTSMGLYGGNYGADDWKNVITADFPDGFDFPSSEDDKSYSVNYLTAGVKFTLESKASGSIGWEWLGLDADRHFSNDERLKDTWEFSAGASVTPSLVLWDVKAGIFKSTVKAERTFGPYNLWELKGPLLYSDLKSLKLKANNDGSLNITANLKTPLFGAWNETEYGVCIEKYGMTDLRMYKLTDRIKPDKDNDNKFTYNLVDANGKPVKLNSFESGATYAIYPYVKDKWSKNYIFRKGTTFIPTESGLKFNTIDDVPGVEL